MVGIRNPLKGFSFNIQGTYATVADCIGIIWIFIRRMFALAQIGSTQAGLWLGEISSQYVTQVFDRFPKTREWWTPILSLEEPVIERQGTDSEIARPNPRYERLRAIAEIAAVILVAVLSYRIVQCLHPALVRWLALLMVWPLITYFMSRALLFSIQQGKMRFIVVATETVLAWHIVACLCSLLGTGTLPRLVLFAPAWIISSAYLPGLLVAWQRLSRLIQKHALALVDALDKWAASVPETDASRQLRKKMSAPPIMPLISWTRVITTSAVLIAIVWVILPMQSMPWWLVSVMSALITLLSLPLCRTMSRGRSLLAVWADFTRWMMRNLPLLND